MSLSQEYRAVAQWNDGASDKHLTIHAVLGVADKTMCGNVDVLDVVSMQNRIVNCADCLRALKRERQRRSAEGTARYQERMRQESAERAQESMREAAWEADAERAERQSLAETLADALYNKGYEDNGTRGQDARGTEEWQAVVDAIMGAE